MIEKHKNKGCKKASSSKIEKEREHMRGGWGGGDANRKLSKRGD